MKTFKTLLLASLFVALTSINAHAIGKTEKGVLIGIGSVLLLPTIFDNAGKLFGNYQNNQNVMTRVVHEPVGQKVVYRTRVVEKIYYEPRRKSHYKRHHRKHHRYTKRNQHRYGSRY